MENNSNTNAAIVEALTSAQALKDTLRSGRTGAGTRESTAEHSWALCLLVLLLEPQLTQQNVDMLQLLRLCILHDLGEAVTGDIPAIEAVPGQDKNALERAGVAEVLAPLPEADRLRLMEVWDTYDAAVTPEARLAKGLDKIETMVQHVAGSQQPGFDFAWNLGYGRNWTDGNQAVRELREIVDDLTRQATRDQQSGTRV